MAPVGLDQEKCTGAELAYVLAVLRECQRQGIRTLGESPARRTSFLSNIAPLPGVVNAAEVQCSAIAMAIGLGTCEGLLGGLFRPLETCPKRMI